MAPTTVSSLSKRYFYYGSYGCSYYGNCSGWYYWGRWVLLGVIILVAFLVFWLYICARNRRRAKSGLPPAYGTQWLGRTNGYGWGGGNNNVQPQATGPGPYYAGTYPDTQSPPAYNNYQGTYHYAQNGAQNGPQTGEVYEMGNYPPPTSPPPAATHVNYNNSAYNNYGVAK